MAQLELPLSVVATAPPRPLYVRSARGLHRAIGWAALLLGFVHEGAVMLIARDRSLEWLGMQLVIGAAVIAPGLWMMRSARRVREGEGPSGVAIGASVSLVIVCLWQLVGWRAALPAVFAGLGVVDGIVQAWVPRRRLGVGVVVTMMFLVAALVLFAAVMQASDLIEP